MAVWGGCYHYQTFISSSRGLLAVANTQRSGYTRETVTGGENVRMDFHDSGYAGRVVLYIVSSFLTFPVRN